MDINNLEAFIEVAEKKSFSRSAESLNLTQPAVSKRIAALESELASRLFDRVGRSVHLTEAGKVLLPSALKISSEVSRIESEISSLGKEVGGKLSIGASEHVGLDRLAPVLKAYKENYPDVEINLHFLTTDEALANIETGKLDMSLCSINQPGHIDKAQSRLLNIEVWNESLRVVVEKGHPLARLSAVTAADLAQYPGILPVQQSAVRQSVDQLMAEKGLDLKIAMEAADFPTAKSMASIGLGWAVLPASELDDNLSLVQVSDLPLRCSVALVRNPDRSMSRAAQAFVDSLPAQLI